MIAAPDILDNPLRHFLCGMFIKDTKGVYTWVSDGLLNLQKLASYEILGKSDHDLPWSGHAQKLRLHDQEVLDQKMPVAFREIIHRRGRDIDGICHKSPVYDHKGQIGGISGIFIDVPRLKMPMNIKLSVRERQCLINLAQGMSAKESAEKLGLSHRTVEDYLEKLRGKLHCRNQAELLSFFYEHLTDF